MLRILDSFYLLPVVIAARGEVGGLLGLSGPGLINSGLFMAT